MANEFKVKNGLIVIGDLTTSGTITINGALAATQSWVTSQAYLTSASLSGYATQSYVTSAISSLIDAAPATLDTLNELAAALGDDANFSTTITNSIASKQSQLNGTGLVRMSGTSVSYDNTTYLVSNFGNIEGDHSYGYPSSDGWYKIAEVVLNGTCQSYNLWGEYRDTGYYDNSHYRIHITARAECDFPTNNESHAINVNIYGSSTNETYFTNNVRVVLTSSSSNYRKYELQYYRATWDTGSWNLQTLGWTTYTTSQTAGTPTGTPRVYYISKFVADNIYAANKISIGTTYSGFTANIAGTTYIIGASVWVNDGYGYANASSNTGMFPDSSHNISFKSNNSTKVYINAAGNVGIGTSSPSALLVLDSGEPRFRMNIAGTNHIIMNHDGTTGVLRTESATPLTFGTNGSEKMRITSAGDVGIGTTTPAQKLEVAGKIRLTDDIQLWSANPTILWESGALRFYNNSTATERMRITDVGNVGIGTTSPYAGTNVTSLDISATAYPVLALSIASSYIGGMIGFSNHVAVSAKSGNYITLEPNDTEAVRITSAGLVGIGISSPARTLDINGTTNFRDATYFANGGVGYTTWGTINGNLALNLQAASGYFLNFGTNGSTGRMVIDTSGNVGIGTTDPTSQMSGTFGIGIYNALYPAVGFKNSTTAWLWYGQDSTFRMWNVTTGDILTANTSGNIGIGTNSPSTKLDVNGVITATGGNSTNWNTAYSWGNHASAGYLTSYTETDTLASVTGRGASTSTAVTFNGGVNLAANTGIRKSGDNWIIGYDTSLPGIVIGSGTVTDKVSISAGGTQKVWFDTNGKVGIGTSTPAEELHVVGRGIFDGGSGNSSTDAVVYITKSNNNDWGLYVNNAALDYGMYTRISSSANYAFTIHNGTTWTTRITGNAIVYLGEKNAIEGNYDSWLRLNNSNHYASGVYTPGVMRADGGFQVSGNTVIHSGTIGSQSVSYANNAGYAAEAGQVINQSGQLLRFDNRIISPSETTAGYLQFGFTSWGNDNSSPYADYLHMRSYTDGSGGNDNLVMFLKSGIGMRIYQQTFGSATAYSSYADVWTSANFTSTNVSNWNTAYGWGNHASASYATTSYVTTQINNLINGAPGVLDTLDELAAALGDDANFATTVTNSIAGKVSKSGDTMTGALTLNAGLNAYAAPIYVNEIIFRDTAGSPASDPYSMRWVSESSTRGAGLSWLEFQLNDDNNEEIRIYGNSCVGYGCGAYSENLYHRFRADGYAWHGGNLSVVGTITASGYNDSNWNTAYGWGNHASAGYALNSSLANYLPLSGGVIGGGVTINGNLTVNGTITENSSIKLKENVETSEGNLEKVVNLRPVTYNKIGSQTTELGLIAEEVAEVYPEFVQYDENGEPIGVNYSRLTAALIGAVKELNEQLQELKRNK